VTRSVLRYCYVHRSAFLSSNRCSIWCALCGKLFISNLNNRTTLQTSALTCSYKQPLSPIFPLFQSGTMKIDCLDHSDQRTSRFFHVSLRLPRPRNCTLSFTFMRFNVWHRLKLWTSKQRFDKLVWFQGFFVASPVTTKNITDHCLTAYDSCFFGKYVDPTELIKAFADHAKCLSTCFRAPMSQHFVVSKQC